MNDPYETKIHQLKHRQRAGRRVVVMLLLGALALVMLCGVINVTFFAAGVALSNVWPFPLPSNNSTPNMIAAYHTNQIPEPAPAVVNTALYAQTFHTKPLPHWQSFADGWDVINGVYYGSNTRADSRSEAVYGRGYTWADYAVEADVTAAGTTAPASAGLLFRYQADHYGGQCRLATRATGQRQLELVTPEGELLASSFHFVTGEAYRLRATAVANALSCEVVGYPNTRLTASTTVLNGTVGFQNRFMTGAFDNLEVTLAP